MIKCICFVHADERHYEKTWQRRTRHKVKEDSKHGKEMKRIYNIKIWTWDRYRKIW